MSREIEAQHPPRAVSPWFRAFGRGPVFRPDEVPRLSDFPGNHRGEWMLLSLLMPLMLGGVCLDALQRALGTWPALLLCLPVLFIGSQVLAFGLRVGSPQGAFWLWSAGLTLWSWWQLKDGGSPVGRVFAWGWAAFLAAQLAALPVLGWRRLMRVPGRAGVVVRAALALALHLAMAVLWWRFGWPVGVATGAGICALWCWGTFRTGSQLYGPVSTRVAGRGVLLTIDDGPDPADTPAILDELDRHGVKAVFFLIGEKVRRHPELAREIVARGHQVANHSMTHPQASMWCAGPARTRREIEDAQRVIEEVTGVRPRWFRAPVGHRNYFTHPVAMEHGLEVVAWSRRAFDTVERDLDKIVAALTDAAVDGDILLLHEATPVARELVPAVLRRLAERGLLGPVSACGAVPSKK